MVVEEHWDALFLFFVESREGANMETVTGGSVGGKVAGDRTLRARFALMALIVNCGEYGCQKKTRENKQTRKQKKAKIGVREMWGVGGFGCFC